MPVLEPRGRRGHPRILSVEAVLGDIVLSRHGTWKTSYAGAPRVRGPRHGRGEGSERVAPKKRQGRRERSSMYEENVCMMPQINTRTRASGKVRRGPGAKRRNPAPARGTADSERLPGFPGAPRRARLTRRRGQPSPQQPVRADMSRRIGLGPPRGPPLELAAGSGRIREQALPRSTVSGGSVTAELFRFAEVGHEPRTGTGPPPTEQAWSGSARVPNWDADFFYVAGRISRIHGIRPLPGHGRLAASRFTGIVHMPRRELSSEVRWGSSPLDARNADFRRHGSGCTISPQGRREAYYAFPAGTQGPTGHAHEGSRAAPVLLAPNHWLVVTLALRRHAPGYPAGGLDGGTGRRGRARVALGPMDTDGGIRPGPTSASADSTTTGPLSQSNASPTPTGSYGRRDLPEWGRRSRRAAARSLGNIARDGYLGHG